MSELGILKLTSPEYLTKKREQLLKEDWHLPTNY